MTLLVDCSGANGSLLFTTAVLWYKIHYDMEDFMQVYI